MYFNDCDECVNFFSRTIGEGTPIGDSSICDNMWCHRIENTGADNPRTTFEVTISYSSEYLIAIGVLYTSAVILLALILQKLERMSEDVTLFCFRQPCVFGKCVAVIAIIAFLGGWILLLLVNLALLDHLINAIILPTSNENTTDDENTDNYVICNETTES